MFSFLLLDAHHDMGTCPSSAATQTWPACCQPQRHLHPQHPRPSSPKWSTHPVTVRRRWVAWGEMTVDKRKEKRDRGWYRRRGEGLLGCGLWSFLLMCPLHSPPCDLSAPDSKKVLKHAGVLMLQAHTSERETVLHTHQHTHTQMQESYITSLFSAWFSILSAPAYMLPALPMLSTVHLYKKKGLLMKCV